MSKFAEPTAQKDEAYYWPDNVTFRVEGFLFRLPRFQFITGSEHFAQKYRLRDDNKGAKEAIHLDGVAAADFRVFLEFLFPLPSNTPLASVFTKEEWLTILTLCTKWHFPEFRALAIQNLDGKLTELELIHVGRSLRIPHFLLEGYRAVIRRPKEDIITDDEAAVMGHKAASKLWIIRYQVQVSRAITEEQAMDLELRSRFADELHAIEDEGLKDVDAEQEYAAEKQMPGACGEEFAADEWRDETDRQEYTVPERLDQEVTERIQLERTLEMLNEEEREIQEQLKQVRSRKLTPQAAENLEAVQNEMKERIEGELKNIEDAKLAEEEAKKQLAEHDAEARRESPHPTYHEVSRIREGLVLQLDTLSRRRAELEQEHISNKGKETGQIIRWRKVGKRHNQKALEKWNAELLRCQSQREDAEEQLLRLLGLEKMQDTDSIQGGDQAERGDESGEAASTQAETGQASFDEVGEVATAEDEEQSECSEELATVRQQKQAHLQKETKLIAQKADFSRKLESVEELMRQGGVLLPQTIEKREAKKKKCQSKLLAIEMELKEVRQVLEMTRVEEERLEEEKRWL